MVINMLNKAAMHVENKVYNFYTVLIVLFHTTDLWMEVSFYVVIYLNKYVM
jgi:hypothetical protein